MGSLFGGGASGSVPQPYIPSGQATLDPLAQSIISGYGQQIAAGTTPGQANLPLEQATLANIANNPYAQAALQGAQTGGGYGQEAAAGAASFLPFLQSMPGELSNQFIGPLEEYAGKVAGLAPQVSDIAGELRGYMPKVASYADPTAALAPRVAAGIDPLQQASGTILQTGYDPQRALYNQLLNQTQQQAAVANAQTGAYGPYAAGGASDAVRNFMLNWQNQQLDRQARALQAAQGGYGTAGQLGTEAANIYTSAAGDIGRAAQIGGEAGQLYGRAGQLYDQAGNLTNLGAQLYLQDPKLIQDILNVGQGAQNLEVQATGLPYNTYLGQQQAIQNAITPALEQEQKQYYVPQLAIQDINQYMQTAQNAQQQALEARRIADQEAQQRRSNIGSLIGLGLGAVTGGFGGFGGLGGLGGLFGGAGGGGIGSPDFSSDPGFVSPFGLGFTSDPSTSGAGPGFALGNQGIVDPLTGEVF